MGKIKEGINYEDATDFASLYEEVRPTLYSTFLKLSDRRELKQADQQLDDIVKGIMLASSLDDSNKDVYKIMEFITLSGMLAVNRSIIVDSDKDVTEFAYEGAFDHLIAWCKLIKFRDPANNGSMLNKLIAKKRGGCDCNQYLSGNFALVDLKSICKLLDEDTSINLKGKNDLLNGLYGFTKESIETTKEIIKTRYTFLMEGAFGIDENVGILTLGNVGSGQRICNGGVRSIEPNLVLSNQFTPIIKSCLDYEVVNSNDRQFDKKLIADRTLQYKEENLVPVYFPYKVLELIAKRQLTSKTKAYVYNSPKERTTYGSLKSYLKELDKYFNTELTYFLYILATKYVATKFEMTDLKKIDTKIMDILYAHKSAEQESFRDILCKGLKYYADCVTTAVVVTTLKTYKEKDPFGDGTHLEISDFRIKITGKMKPTETGEILNNKYFMKQLAVNNRQLEDYYKPSDEKCETDTWGFGRVVLAHTFNAEMASALPSFAYKALSTLLERATDEEVSKGVLSWNKILLGREADGTLVTSSAKSVDDMAKVNMQDNRLHFIIAGSRSGKGVMCFNIFSTAIGSKIPIFYCDRKPDTAVVMKSIAPEMFVVNGGQYSESFDLGGNFKQKVEDFMIPEYAESLFSDLTFCYDYAYFRGLMLFLTMVIYADMCKDEMGVKLSKAFSNGCVLVLDEFTNYVSEFLSKFTPAQGGFFAGSPSAAGIKQMQSAHDGMISKAETEYTKGQKSGKSQEQLDIAKNLSTMSAEKQFEWGRILKSAIALSYQGLKDKIDLLKNSGGDAINKMHIFIIGQSVDNIISAFKKDCPDWFPTSANTASTMFNKPPEGCIPLVRILSSMRTDFIAGFQPDLGSYLAQRDPNQKSIKYLTGSERCFAYRNFNNANEESFRKIVNTEDAFNKNADSIKRYLNEWHFFKPFLILNNSAEPPEDLRINPDGVSNEAWLSMLKGLSPAPDGQTYLDSQYLGQTVYYAAQSGITYDDILHDNSSVNDESVMHEGIGFQGYIQMLNGGSTPVDDMNVSGRLATEFVQKVFGYDKDYYHFLCDFRPEYIIFPSAVTSMGMMSVIERLKTTFFHESSVLMSDKFSEQLGSLYPYYAKMLAELKEKMENRSYGTTVENPTDIDYEPADDDEDDEDDENPIQVEQTYTPEPVIFKQGYRQSSTPAPEPVKAYSSDAEEYEAIQRKFYSNTTQVQPTSVKESIGYAEITKLVFARAKQLGVNDIEGLQEVINNVMFAISKQGVVITN